MKNWPSLFLFAVMAAISLSLTACGSSSDDVASLGATPSPAAADQTPDNETLMLEYTACLRDQGLEVMDPVVNADGLVGKPQIPEGASKNEIGAALEVCEHLLEGFTFEQKKGDTSEELDQYLALAECLREEGIDIDDPTAATLETWMGDFKFSINWDDPAEMEIFETCSGGDIGTGDKKGK